MHRLGFTKIRSMHFLSGLHNLIWGHSCEIDNFVLFCRNMIAFVDEVYYSKILQGRC